MRTIQMLLFNLSLMFFLIAAAPQTFAANMCSGVHRIARPVKSEDVSVYFVIPGKVGRGNLDDTRALLPSFEAAGVKNIWLGPIHPQTKSEYGIHGKNDHGYWPSDHGKIALGGEAAFSRLVQDGQKRGVGIWVDAVIGHFGYGEAVEINGRRISLEDTKFFHVSKTGTPLVDPRMNELSAQLDGAKDTKTILELQKQISQIPIYHLPKIRHEIPEMANYLIESYGRFVDLGVAGFRIDAAKHIDLDFLKRFVNELQERGIRKNGRAPEFLFEMTISNSQTLDALVNYIRMGAKDPNSIYAIDFPLAYELRRLEDPNFRMDWLVGFVSHRWQNKQKMRNLVPFVENHDFEGALKDPFTVQLTYSLADFFSGQSPIVSHGLEAAHRQSSDSRKQIQQVDPNAELLKMRKAISTSLGSKRRQADGFNFHIVAADHHFLMAERKIDHGGKLVMVINKSEQNAEAIPLSDVGALPKVVYATGDSRDQARILRNPNTGELTVQLPPQSFILFEKR